MKPPPLTPEDLPLPPLHQEIIPDHPPEPNPRWSPDLPAEQRAHFATALRFIARLSRDLLESASRLVELAKQREGRYREGMAIPASCRAASTGAILVACAAFEAALNEGLADYQSAAEQHETPARVRLCELAMKLTPKERLETLAALEGQSIEWGAEPYQSLSLILSIRKHALHHEPFYYTIAEGEWPAKHLADLPRRIQSPYPTGPRPDGPPMAWHEHLFTPAGAAWCVRCICEVVGIVEDLEREHYLRVKPPEEGEAT